MMLRIQIIFVLVFAQSVLKAKDDNSGTVSGQLIVSSSSDHRLLKIQPPKKTKATNSLPFKIIHFGILKEQILAGNVQIVSDNAVLLKSTKTIGNELHICILSLDSNSQRETPIVLKWEARAASVSKDGRTEEYTFSSPKFQEHQFHVAFSSNIPRYKLDSVLVSFENAKDAKDAKGEKLKMVSSKEWLIDLSGKNSWGSIVFTKAPEDHGAGKILTSLITLAGSFFTLAMFTNALWLVIGENPKLKKFNKLLVKSPPILALMTYLIVIWHTSRSIGIFNAIERHNALTVIAVSCILVLVIPQKGLQWLLTRKKELWIP